MLHDRCIILHFDPSIHGHPIHPHHQYSPFPSFIRAHAEKLDVGVQDRGNEVLAELLVVPSNICRSSSERLIERVEAQTEHGNFSRVAELLRRITSVSRAFGSGTVRWDGGDKVAGSCLVSGRVIDYLGEADVSSIHG